MRTIEWIYVIFNAVMVMGMLSARSKSRGMLWGGFAGSAFLFLLHGFTEGLRWPLIPGYLLTLIPLIWLVKMFAKSRKQPSARASAESSLLTSTTRYRSKIAVVALSALTLVYAALAAALPLLFPVFSFDKPAGPYGIGTVSYHWIDNSREELLTKEDGDKRELMVKIWYPASKSEKGTTAPYMSDSAVYATAFDEVLKLPKLLFSSLGDVKTHAIESASLSETEAKYPLLIFSHGLHGYENQNTFQVEQLVSQGYIVVGINHTYSSLASVFPDGRVAQFVSEGKEGFEQMQFSYLDKLNETWVKDVQFVLDEVEKLAAYDPDNRFTGHIELEQIGMFGHSFGGATTVQMLMDEPRIKAGINMDGVLFGEKRIPSQGVGKPFLMISADETVAGTSAMSDEYIADMGTTRPEVEKYYEEVYSRYAPVTAGGNYWMKLSHTKHLSFSDLYLVSPLLEWSQGVDVSGTFKLVNEFTLDFFNHYLKGLPLKHLNREAGDQPAFSLEQG
ncbi:acetylhydrolase [Paenibacillus sp. BIHB 4019]|uniref:Acetylhydrolase n=1 Tax=Paenibacillus sp. BIHB 4019 TaxID=1870819 RepID=A0A1B2DIH2_9BACL|nr:acetylhydrolase [Paenibacillus sp. BIHB 4019]ANY67530.1 acetylhydrolase [Paenibacillus sp. BIHB 4019]